MIKVKIIKNKKEVSDPETFLKKEMKTISLYDPLGLHTIESPYYVISFLLYLKTFKEIDNYEILTSESEFPEFESDPGVVY